MTAWLDPVIALLDEAPAPVDFFFRDDDAGWADDALFALLDVFEQRAAPVDVAVIPAATRHAVARELAGRVARGAVRLHQHGWSHSNHQRDGRKCEFGPDRARAQQMADILAGRDRLRALFGTVEPVFTPPWNRCTTTTGACLAELGFGVLSRDVTATALDQPGLAEVPVSVDWSAQLKGRRVGRTQVGQLIAGRVASGGPVGVMLHHAITDADDLAAVGQLLSVIADHPQARSVQLMAAAKQ